MRCSLGLKQQIFESEPHSEEHKASEGVLDTAVEFYTEHILPNERQVASTFSKAFIAHSDGDMTPLLEAWLDLGQDAIHPIQPDVMDIGSVKAAYGDRVAMVGNIFMNDLVNKSPKEIDAQVQGRIQQMGKSGYIISSSNSLTDDMKPENVIAMRDAVIKYG